MSQALVALNGLATSAQKQVDARGADLEQLLKSAERVTQQTDLVIADLNRMVAERSPLRGNLDAATRDLAASASSLRGFTRAIERDPSLLLRGRSGQ